MTDPPRWIDGGGPEGAKEVLEALLDPPTMPLKLYVHPKEAPRRVQWEVVLLASGLLLVLGGVTLFVWWKASRPMPAISVVSLEESTPEPARPDTIQAPPVAPTNGTLRVIWSERVGIRVNGVLLGTTPLNIELPVGEHRIEVEMPSGERLEAPSKQVYAGGVTTLTNLSADDFRREESRLGFR